jgi:predicted PurR-regulated permease PerM
MEPTGIKEPQPAPGTGPPAGPGAASLYSRGFAVAVFLLIGYAVVKILTPFVGPLTWAIFLAFILHPFNRFARRKLGSRGAAAGVLTALTPLAILLPLSGLSVQFVTQVSGLLIRVQQAAKKFDIHSLQDMTQFPWIARLNTWAQTRFSVTAEQIQGWAVSGAQELLQAAANVGSSLFLGTMNTVAAFVLMLFLLFFFLRDGDVMFVRARALIPLAERRKEHLLTHVSELTRAIVFGTVTTAVLQGFMVGLGFAICSLPSPVVFGVAAALLSMLPIGGTAIIWVPAAIALFVQGRWGFGIFMVVWGVLSSSVDNVVRPMLISGRAKISSLAVFIGVLGGIGAFGPLGIILGPVILSLALVLLEFTEESRA